MVKVNIDILIVSEIKTWWYFPDSTLYRSDTNSNDGGINLFVREDIPFNLLVNENKSVESMYI